MNTATEKYTAKKLAEWEQEERKQFLNAYLMGDWATVDGMTSDITGGQHTRNLKLATLFDAISCGNCATAPDASAPVPSYATPEYIAEVEGFDENELPIRPDAAPALVAACEAALVEFEMLAENNVYGGPTVQLRAALAAANRK